jgi:hypothetical protein
MRCDLPGYDMSSERLGAVNGQETRNARARKLVGFKLKAGGQVIRPDRTVPNRQALLGISVDVVWTLVWVCHPG